jgi:ATP-binding cassette, subfamily B, multidrug efflux pump
VIRLLRSYLRPYGWKIVLVLALLLLQAIGNLYLPTLQGDIINNGVAKGDTDYIGSTGIVMLLFTLAVAVASVLGVYWGAQIAMGFGRDVRSALFRQVESFSQVEVNHFGTPSLITRNTNDVQQVQMLVFMVLTVMASAPLLIIGGIILALQQDVPLSGLLLVALPAMAIFIGLVMSRAIPLFRAMQVKVDRINQVMRETLAGVRVIRAFVRTRHEERRFDDANRDLFNTALRVNRLFAVTIPVMTLILNASTVGVMWFGALRVDSGEMPIGNLTAFLQYLLQIMFAMLMAVFMFVFVPRAAVSAGRIQEVLETEPSIRDPQRPVRLAAIDGDGDGDGDRDGAQPKGGRVEFRNVEFRYPGAQDPVLRDVSFEVHPGETVAIVGSTGSGKSTLINLIPRLYDATEGTVLVDGVDVREVDRADLWERLGVIPQKAFLFSGTVASNLRFGDQQATDEQLWAALETAQGRDFVTEMEGQLQAPVTQGGTNVSGGQRQRLAIARALVKRAGILIFDDSFSALDFGTDARLRAALDRDMGWATRIIVAQRVGTIMKADRILVMDAGRIVGSGTHTELLASNETYREIVYSQLSEAEAVA